MLIVADENIPFAQEAFSALGNVRRLPGRQIDSAALADADLLLVRSITRVNSGLLAGSSVRFVGTATIGTDHIDTDCLRDKGIAFSSAPGCNANSVAEYITAALLELAQRHELELSGLRLGIIGVGNVGSRVRDKAAALGMTCILNDPPRAEATGDPVFRPLDELFDCDVITLHTPLVQGGAHPTHHLVDESFLGRLSPDTILINTSRGAVIDNQALRTTLQAEKLRTAVLDVWEDEPLPNTELMELVSIASPHIAGYSFDGKVNGTRQIYEAACGFLEQKTDWDPAPLLPEPAIAKVTCTSASDAVSQCVRAAYDIIQDDRDIRAIANLEKNERGAAFDALRKNYRCRREFPSIKVELSGDAVKVADQLSALGFRCNAQ